MALSTSLSLSLLLSLSLSLCLCLCLLHIMRYSALLIDAEMQLMSDVLSRLSL